MNRILPVFVLALVVAIGGCSGSERTATSDEGEQAPIADTGMSGSGVSVLHPEFSLSAGELDSMTAGLPSAMRDRIAENPEEFLSMLAAVLDQPESLTWLVDKTHALAADYAPSDLVSLDQYDQLTLRNTGLKLRRAIMPGLLDMVNAARGEGVDLELSSTYRSYAYQEQVYRRWVNDLGQEEADRVSARPGHSQHQLGTVIDFGCICREIENQPDGRWLLQHAWRYGFSLSYPTGYSDLTGYDYEPWHYRFIGIAASTLEHRYFDGIQQYMLEFIDANRHLLEQVYRPTDR